MLRRITGMEVLGVNSLHHQALKALAPGLVINALSLDGLIEGVEMPGKKFVLGTQWHPEILSGACPEAQALFDAFIAACSR